MGLHLCYAREIETAMGIRRTVFLVCTDVSLKLETYIQTNCFDIGGISVTRLHLLLIISLVAAPLLATEITVDIDGGGAFNSIADGLVAAADGDTITVWPGLYAEHLVVEKSVYIRSRDGRLATRIEGPDPQRDVIDILIDRVEISGFEISGGRCGLNVQTGIVQFGIIETTIGETDSFHASLTPDTVEPFVMGVDLASHASGMHNAIAIKAGTVTKTTSWPAPPAGFVYYLDDLQYVTVAGQTEPILFLAPGTIFKLKGDTGITVRDGGGLNAAGVTFTSYNDDSLGGDTTGNGATAGDFGDWGHVQFFDSCRSEVCFIVDCQFRYGGQTVSAMVSVSGAPISIQGCTFAHSDGSGLSINNVTMPIVGCTFTDNLHSLYLGGTSSAELITANTILGQRDHPDSHMLHCSGDEISTLVANNTLVPRNDGRFGRIGILNTPMTQSNTWPASPAGLVYEIEGLSFAHPTASVLTLLPGTILKISESGVSVGYHCGLIADGVTFTSYRDDSVGGDSNGDGPSSGEPGDWDSVSYTENAIAENSALSNCVFRYGSSFSSSQMVAIWGTPLPVRNCVFEYSLGRGLGIFSADVPVTDCIFRNNLLGLDLHVGSSSEWMTGNVIQESELRFLSCGIRFVSSFLANNTLVPRASGRAAEIEIKGTLGESEILSVAPAGFVYYANSVIKVSGAASPVLTLQSGTICKFAQSGRFWVESGAGFIADGVIFTSNKDDGVAGDSNGDGDTTLPTNNDWRGVEFFDGSTGSVTNCDFRFSGGGMIHNAGSDVTVSASSFLNNFKGIYARPDARPVVVGCCFSDNVAAGIAAEPSAETVEDLVAQGCWWGDASGPSGAGPGMGDAVSSDVLFEPWSTVELCDDYPAPVPQHDVLAKAGLYSVYPNPFNPQTTIVFELPREQAVSLRVFDVSGRLVDVLMSDEMAQQGRNEVTWRGRDRAGRELPSGTYFYRLDAGEFSDTKRMTMIK